MHSNNRIAVHNTELFPIAGAQEFCNSSEFHRLKAQLSEQETKWRKAYEKVVKENELLRTRGGETVLAVQWRERYEVRVRVRVRVRVLEVHVYVYSLLPSCPFSHHTFMIISHSIHPPTYVLIDFLITELNSHPLFRAISWAVCVADN